MNVYTHAHTPWPQLKSNGGGLCLAPVDQLLDALAMAGIAGLDVLQRLTHRCMYILPACIHPRLMFGLGIKIGVGSASRRVLHLQAASIHSLPSAPHLTILLLPPPTFTRA